MPLADNSDQFDDENAVADQLMAQWLAGIDLETYEKDFAEREKLEAEKLADRKFLNRIIIGGTAMAGTGVLVVAFGETEEFISILRYGGMVTTLVGTLAAGAAGLQRFVGYVQNRRRGLEQN